MTKKGKTIKFICDKLDRIVIFIPNTLIESTINNQGLGFLKSITYIVIIDDCEDVV
jgi:hypothetical protein